MNSRSEGKRGELGRECDCGCGKLTSSAEKRWLRGHAANATRAKSFGSQCVVEDRGHETPCIVWVGKKTSNGYGLYRGEVAHRYAWKLQRGRITDGMQLDHLCRQRDCVHPHHLEQVTPSQNVQRSSLAKLTEDDVAEMRRLREEGALLVTLVERFGVSKATVSRVCRGLQWR